MTPQTSCDRFLHANKDRIHEVGGLVLFDDDPEYLSIAPDGSFRSRSALQDAETGEWRTETEVIESVSDLVELYNPSELYAAFAEAARAGGRPAGRADRCPGPAGGRPASRPRRAWASASVAATRTSVRPTTGPRARTIRRPPTRVEVARRLYDLALTFQERSQLSEARLIEQFESPAQPLAGRLGDQLLLDDDDERLWFKGHGAFEAEVIPERDEDDEDEGRWVASRAPRNWSSSTTRPTSSVTSPRRSPSSTRRSRPRMARTLRTAKAPGTGTGTSMR